jgi:hypothetical protein
MNILSNRLLLKPIIPIDNPHRRSGDLLGSMVDTMNNEINGEANKHEARCAKHGSNN